MKRLIESRKQDNQQDDSTNIMDSTSSCDSSLEPSLKKQLINCNSSESSYLVLGNNYFNGENGVVEDCDKAFDYYLKGAEEGCVKSMYNIGFCYDEGLGVEQDYSKAMEWYLKASEGGNERAQHSIGELYEEGYGVEQDYCKAFEWYLKSAENGNKEAQYSLALLYVHGNGVEKDYCKAFEWCLKAANNGNKKAQYSLGFSYTHGKGVDKDYVKAFEWYLKSAENSLCAQFRVGQCYEKGYGVEKDYSKAMEWYLKAKNHTKAQNNIGRLFKYGKGVKKDLPKALDKIAKSATKGCKQAQTHIGRIFKNGEGVEKDLNKSFYWLTKGLNDTNFKVIDLNEFGIEEFKNDEITETSELTNTELISKVIIRLREKDFSISSNNLSNSKYLTTMMNQNWRNFNQKEDDQIILDLTAIENEIFQQETNHIQIFEIYFNYLLNNELPIDFKLDLKLKLIELSRYLADDQFILQILKQSCLLTRYYILFKFEMIQPIHNMMASCCSAKLHDLPPEELEILLSQSELSSLAKRDIFESFVEKNNKYPNSIIFSKLMNDTYII